LLRILHLFPNFLYERFIPSHLHTHLSLNELYIFGLNSHD
jgi:hypothetical protein